ncbi:MAG TPA: DUF2232 domain-containing protein [Syntrophales bacterium]|nr:DUF2232 domain-containing protein [Syntrophales bacterium]
MRKERGEFFSSNFFIGIAISSLAFLAALLIPIIGPFFFIISPLPIFYYYSKTGRVQGSTIFAISLSLVAIILTIFDSSANIPLLFLLGSLGVILSEIFRKNYSIETTIILPVLVLTILWFTFIFFQSLSLGKQPWLLIEDYIERDIQEIIQLYAQLDIPVEQIDLAKNNIKQITHFFTNIFPAILLVSASFTVWINIMAARELFQKNRIWYPDFGDLSRWKAPESLIWILIANGVMLLIPVEWVQILGLNLLLICLFVYFLQGMSVIGFLFKAKNVHRLFRIPCYVLIFAQQYIILIVIAVGIIDLWIDFRKFINPLTDATT